MMINANTNKEEKAKIDGSHSEKCIALQTKHFHVSNAIMETMTRNFSVRSLRENVFEMIIKNLIKETNLLEISQAANEAQKRKKKTCFFHQQT